MNLPFQHFFRTIFLSFLLVIVFLSSYLRIAPVYSFQEETHNTLDVPHFFQNDPNWADDEYAHAFNWELPMTKIKDLGSLLTSQAMLLNYYGVHYTPDGDSLTPQTLNDWLRENEGYIGKGLIDWFALANMTEIIHLTDDESPVLGFEKIAESNVEHFVEQVSQNQPEILEIKNFWSENFQHFVVGIGHDSTNLIINDPLGKYRELSRITPIASRSVFSPELANSSGLLLLINSEVDFVLIDSDGNETGTSPNFGIVEDIAGSAYSEEKPYFYTKEALDLNIAFEQIMVFQPKKQQYTLHVFSTPQHTYDLEIRMYNSNSTSIDTYHFNEFIGDNSYHIYSLVFADLTKENSVVREYEQEPVSFSKLSYYLNKNISNRFARNTLLKKLLLSEALYEKDRDWLGEKMLGIALDLVNVFKGKYFDEKTAATLTAMIEELKESFRG